MRNNSSLSQSADYRLSPRARVDGDYSIGGLVFDGSRYDLPDPQGIRTTGKNDDEE